jgi:hypothetical protein
VGEEIGFSVSSKVRVVEENILEQKLRKNNFKVTRGT